LEAKLAGNLFHLDVQRKLRWLRNNGVKSDEGSLKGQGTIRQEEDLAEKSSTLLP